MLQCTKCRGSLGCSDGVGPRTLLPRPSPGGTAHSSAPRFCRPCVPSRWAWWTWWRHPEHSRSCSLCSTQIRPLEGWNPDDNNFEPVINYLFSSFSYWSIAYSTLTRTHPLPCSREGWLGRSVCRSGWHSGLAGGTQSKHGGTGRGRRHTPHSSPSSSPVAWEDALQKAPAGKLSDHHVANTLWTEERRGRVDMSLNHLSTHILFKI